MRGGGSAAPDDDEELVIRYETARLVGRELVQRVMSGTLTREAIQAAASLIGGLVDDVIVLSDEDAPTALFDLALHEMRVDGRTAVEAHLARTRGLSGLEREILRGAAVSRTSLYRVAGTSWPRVRLEDLLDGRGGDVELVDRAMSATAPAGTLVFTRVYPIEDFHMTSGMHYAFPREMRRMLLRRYPILERAAPSDDPSVRRFVALQRLGADHGLEVRYRD